jgi:hypothetical protein
MRANICLLMFAIRSVLLEYGPYDPALTSRRPKKDSVVLFLFLGDPLLRHAWDCGADYEPCRRTGVHQELTWVSPCRNNSMVVSGSVFIKSEPMNQSERAAVSLFSIGKRGILRLLGIAKDDTLFRKDN